LRHPVPATKNVVAATKPVIKKVIENDNSISIALRCLPGLAAFHYRFPRRKLSGAKSEKRIAC